MNRIDLQHAPPPPPLTERTSREIREGGLSIGTKSVLFGAHCFLLHPWFVAWAWWTLYGFPFDPRLWVAFFVHDLGYVGKPNMDGPEGEQHPYFGARLMAYLFDGYSWRDAGVQTWESTGAPMTRRFEVDSTTGDLVEILTVEMRMKSANYGHWGWLTLLHSRYLSKTLKRQPSRLCIADKLAIALTPAWLYLPMVNATGEIHEYMAHAKHRAVGNINISDEERRRVTSASQREWYAGVQSYCRRWAFEHRDGKIDTWTSDARNRATLNDAGVWQ